MSVPQEATRFTKAANDALLTQLDWANEDDFVAVVTIEKVIG